MSHVGSRGPATWQSRHPATASKAEGPETVHASAKPNSGNDSNAPGSQACARRPHRVGAGIGGRSEIQNAAAAAGKKAAQRSQDGSGVPNRATARANSADSRTNHPLAPPSCRADGGGADSTTPQTAEAIQPSHCGKTMLGSPRVPTRRRSATAATARSAREPRASGTRSPHHGHAAPSGAVRPQARHWLARRISMAKSTKQPRPVRDKKMVARVGIEPTTFAQFSLKIGGFLRLIKKLHVFLHV